MTVNVAAKNTRTSSSEGAPLARLMESPFLVGLFLPIQSGAWTPSTAPRATAWTFPYNATLIKRAEQLGFDLAFGLAQWLGKNGYGGAMKYREDALDPLITSAGMASLTERIVLISTVHILYGWHPLHVAKLGATLDHMSGGRWGLNVVTGYRSGEFEMFGKSQIPHDDRYQMADEFTDMMFQLWQMDDNTTFAGKYWKMQDAFVSPKPVHGKPIMVNAAASDVGIEYAAKYCDLIFITSPRGANIDKALEGLPALNEKIKSKAKAHNRRVKTIINPHIISRDTEQEVKAIIDAIVAGEDPIAVDNVMGGFTSGDQKAWREHKRDERIIGGNVQLFGTPEKIVDYCMKLKNAGCDGIQINFFDYIPDLEFFGSRILPLMRQAGLR
jgi:FMNH2-dependent dimethyl sulfone monooxygenase